jgi:hypothetical protein
MIPVARAYFRFDIPAPPEDQLFLYARRLFSQLDGAAETLLPFDDYSLFIAVEEGSVKGGGKVMVRAAALVGLISGYGSFMQGLREVGATGRAVADYFVETAADEVPGEAVGPDWSHKDSGAVRRLENLFVRVRDRELSPEQAAELAVHLLSRDDDLTDEATRQIEEAFQSTSRNPEQLELLPAPPTSIPDVPPPPKPHDTPHPVPHGLRIEISKEGKNNEPKIKRTRF